MKAVVELQRLGFASAVEGDKIRYVHSGERPDPEHVRPLLDYLRRHREEVLSFLQDLAVQGPSSLSGLNAEVEALEIPNANAPADTTEPTDPETCLAEFERRLRERLSGVEMEFRMLENSTADKVSKAVSVEEAEKPWVGKRVRIEDLSTSKARWGLWTMGSEWPEGENRPVVYLRGVQASTRRPRE